MPSLLFLFVALRARTVTLAPADPRNWITALGVTMFGTLRTAVGAAIAVGLALAASTPSNAGASTIDVTDMDAFVAASTAQQNAAVRQQMARRPDGVRIGATRISYDNGTVIYDAGPTSASDCPSSITQDWTCLFDNTSWTGRMLEFKNSGYTQNLDNYGFNNMASSWVNNRGKTAYLHDGTDGSGWSLCLDSHAKSLSMGSYNNDASSIYLAVSQTHC